MPQFLALPRKRFHPKRYRPGNIGTWSGHLPFAHDLIAAARPALLVELGTHYGESYFGFCQAIEENGAACRSYAIDTWLGDDHAGRYGEEVYDDVSRYNQKNYAAFSYLVRKTFDEALAQFADGSIDILHIDGLHTYAAVRHDFEAWRSKVRPGGIVLLHDVEVRHADFEVWNFWSELKREYRTFEFFHYWGLGVLEIPGAAAPGPAFTELLFSAGPEESQEIRDQYARAAELLDLSMTARIPGGPRVQAFAAREGGYAEDASASAEIRTGVWERVTLDLPQGSRGGALRIDPADRPAVIEISGLFVRRAAGGAPLAEYRDPAAIQGLTCSGLIGLPGNGEARFLSLNADPQIFLEPEQPGLFDVPLRIELGLRLSPDLAPARDALQACADSREQLAQRQLDAVRQEAASLRAERDQGAADRSLAMARVEALRVEIGVHQAERVAMTAEYRRLRTEIETLRAEQARSAGALRKEQDLRISIERETAELRGEAAAAQLRIEDLTRRAADVELLMAELNGNRDARRALEGELEQRQSELERREAEYRSELERKQAEIAAQSAEVQRIRGQLDHCRSEAAADRMRWEDAFENQRRRGDEMERSLSWKLTRPVRAVLDLLRGGRKS